jgi:hypothetical protein
MFDPGSIRRRSLRALPAAALFLAEQRRWDASRIVIQVHAGLV